MARSALLLALMSWACLDFQEQDPSCTGGDCADGGDAGADDDDGGDGDPVTGECVSNDDCADENPCTADRCMANTCRHDPAPGPCSDGNACTGGDFCSDGACVSGAAATCPPPEGACEQDGMCLPATGQCIYATKPNDALCDDTSWCTRLDACDAGTCAGQSWCDATPSFTDTMNSQFQGEIAWGQANGITAPCVEGSFCPSASVLRGDFAIFLSRALRLTPSGSNRYDDDDGTPWEPHLNALADLGIISSCAPGQACPSAVLSRGELAVMIARGWALPDSAIDYFGDDSGSPYEPYINRVRHAGILFGCSGESFCASGPVPREVALRALHRAECGPIWWCP